MPGKKMNSIHNQVTDKTLQRNGMSQEIGNAQSNEQK